MYIPPISSSSLKNFCCKKKKNLKFEFYEKNNDFMLIGWVVDWGFVVRMLQKKIIIGLNRFDSNGSRYVDQMIFFKKIKILEKRY